ILSIKEFPKSMIIAGAGVIGSEYACIFAHMGIKVHLLNRHSEILNFVDKDLRELLTKEMKNDGIIFHSNVELEKIKKTKEGKVSVQLNNGVELEAAMLLYCMGRNGNTKNLKLDAIKLKTEKYDLLKVNKNYQTTIKNIYAVGDVVGYPSLASVSAQQGTIAVKDILNLPINSIPELFPYGIYTVPEMSFVGKSETELNEEGTPFVTGIADYREVARGQIQGMVKGLLKMHIHKETLKVLGIHIVGYGATEIIHIGQAVLTFGGDVTYFTNNVFNYPTLAEAYKTAAFSAYNQVPEEIKLKYQ
ncbi:MAG: FAD-dependent oxidoreductase, partial [Calditrichaeota bacterium]|nr:FAD-dependent oxidoreductase [Calditrichota bacterium]